MDTRLTVTETMQNDPLMEPGATTIQAAAQAMRDHGTGCLLVMEGGGLQGILTERDILHKVVAEGRDPGDVLVRDVMTRDVLTVAPGETIIDALRLMKERDIRRLPVVRDGKILGLVTEHLISQVAPELMEIAEDWDRIVHPSNGTLAPEGAEPPKGYREVLAQDSFPGSCEMCGNMDTDLHEANGDLVCTECLEAELTTPRTRRL